MKTIVFQTFRTYDVPTWVEPCLSTVKTWAEESGFSYRLIGDEFLELVPGWYRAKAGGYICVVTDLARLVYARRCLRDGFDRVIWVDADVVVFGPFRLLTAPDVSHTYCREVWVNKDTSGNIYPQFRVNNAVCSFGQTAMEHLNEYIESCLSIVRNLASVNNNVEVGTRFLSDPCRAHNLALIKNVGMISPLVMQALLEDNSELLSRYVGWQGSAMDAANFCNSIRPMNAQGAEGLYDYLCKAVVQKLLSTRGAALGDYGAIRTAV